MKEGSIYIYIYMCVCVCVDYIHTSEITLDDNYEGGRNLKE